MDAFRRYVNARHGLALGTLLSAPRPSTLVRPPPLRPSSAPSSAPRPSTLVCTLVRTLVRTRSTFRRRLRWRSSAPDSRLPVAVGVERHRDRGLLGRRVGIHRHPLLGPVQPRTFPEARGARKRTGPWGQKENGPVRPERPDREPSSPSGPLFFPTVLPSVPFSEPSPSSPFPNASCPLTGPSSFQSSHPGPGAQQGDGRDPTLVRGRAPQPGREPALAGRRAHRHHRNRCGARPTPPSPPGASARLTPPHPPRFPRCSLPPCVPLNPFSLDEGEGHPIERVSYHDLRERVRQCAAALRAAGVTTLDRVTGVCPWLSPAVLHASIAKLDAVARGPRPGYVSNCVEAIVMMLATASIGAIWSSTSPDFGVTVRSLPLARATTQPSSQNGLAHASRGSAGRPGVRRACWSASRRSSPRSSSRSTPCTTTAASTTTCTSSSKSSQVRQRPASARDRAPCTHTGVPNPLRPPSRPARIGKGHHPPVRRQRTPRPRPDPERVRAQAHRRTSAQAQRAHGPC